MTRPRLGHHYALVFTASTISNLGDGILLAALPLLAHRVTSDPVAVSLVTVAATLPWLAFGLVAGAVVDRVDRARLMVRVDVVRTLILVGCSIAVVADRVTLPLLLLIATALGVAETLFDTASQAILPGVVEPSQLEFANGRLFGAQLATNSFVGPPLGAALFGLAASAPLAVDAATFVVSAALLGRLPSIHPVPSGAVTTIRRDVAEGLAWLWRDAGVRAFAVGAAAVNVAHTAVMATVVLFARDDLGVGPLAFGAMLAGAAVGSLAGTQLAPALTARVERRSAVIGSVVAFGAALVVAGTAGNAVTATLGLALFGMAAEVWNVVAVSFRQARVPDRLLGRVMASYRVIAYGSMPLGALLGGLLAGSFGLRAPFFAGAAVVTALLLYFVPATRGEVLRTCSPSNP